MSDIVINNSNVVIQNHISQFTKQRANELFAKKRWKHTFKIGLLRLYITWNWQLKPRNKRDGTTQILGMAKHRKNLYYNNEGKCQMCGKKLKYREFELHHVLPLGRFRHLATDERNMQCLCHSCHSNLHCDPFISIRIMQAKAQELGIDLKDYYEV